MPDYEAMLRELRRLYPEPQSELNFTDPYQTLIATMLAAQSTDKQVNKVTPALFNAYPSPKELAGAEPSDIEPLIQSVGTYHMKAKNIVATCRRIEEVYGGLVPSTMDELVTLPGVGRKTANVVLANAFGGDNIAVDTHVFRVSNRLGLANAKDVLQTELQLQQHIPKCDWSKAHLWILLHGRRVCKARKPACEDCTLRPYCAHPANENAVSV